MLRKLRTNVMLKKTIKAPKKTLNDLIVDKAIVTGKEVLQKINELEIQKRHFEESIEFEQRNRGIKK